MSTRYQVGQKVIWKSARRAHPGVISRDYTITDPEHGFLGYNVTMKSGKIVYANHSELAEEK